LHFLLILGKTHRPNHTHTKHTRAQRFFNLQYTKQHTLFPNACSYPSDIPNESLGNWRFEPIFTWLFVLFNFHRNALTRRDAFARSLMLLLQYTPPTKRAKGNCIYGLCICFYAARAARPLASGFRERI